MNLNIRGLNFDDGDVSVVLTSSQKYQLHSSILRRFSTFFKEKFDENNVRSLKAKQRSQSIAIRWQATLIEPYGESEVGYFDVATLNSKLQSSRMNQGGSCLTDESDIVRHYKNAISACYGKDISLRDDSMDHLLQDAALLMAVTESLGCMSVVTTKMENVLLKQGQPLFQSISQKSMAWADLAFRIQSGVIFKEAIVHLVGQWNKYGNESSMRASILKLCKAKQAELEEIKQAQELRLLGYYPAGLKRDANQVANPASTAIGPGSRGGGAGSLNTRAHSYGLDILAWMALALFRHFTSQSICGGCGRTASDGGYSFYHKLYSGGEDTYLDRDTINLFLEHFPMSTKARSSLEQHLSVMKQHVRTYAVPLVAHNSQLDVTKFKIAYLTCCKVDDAELPWLYEQPAEHVQASPAASDAQAPSTATQVTPESVQPRKKPKAKKGAKKPKARKSSFNVPLKRSQSPAMLVDSIEEPSKRFKATDAGAEPTE